MTSRTFLLRNKSDWAVISIANSPALTVMIYSSYGSWCYGWSASGEDYIKFLETVGPDYTFKKFSNSLRLSASGRIQKREYVSYLDFFNKFWIMMIDELKQNNNSQSKYTDH